jgi:hypothetical protein
MKLLDLEYRPVEGKTYTLFGNYSSTDEFYGIISLLCDKILEKADIPVVLHSIQKYSKRKRYLKKILKKRNDSLISCCLNLIHDDLKQFTKKTRDHLKNLSVFKIWDRRVRTTEEQYHLYMLEIELVNRLNRDAFLKAEKKISLQPYCLQDFSVSCKAVKNDFDYQCMHCSKLCFQNNLSRVMKNHDIEPYIWRGSGIKEAAKAAFLNNKTFGILGIACIAELVWGMRKCRKYNIPVIGIPLNANRCQRWFGEFYENSVDLKKLEKILTK